ncbi:hypothetical protein UFOVP558_27 [uncultured Caudovirales phage]|uniref:Uncharacterized protein n=1 Tax=uncultured Caudovirales phage TaxID=2100421 RepID=A0A6J5MUU3_9CAUD|nr:hypothetical protein UFOVP558_27 [uncultured Caudovirales phage]
MNLLIFIALICGLLAGIELHSMWLGIPCAIALVGWILVGGS